MNVIILIGAHRYAVSPNVLAIAASLLGLCPEETFLEAFERAKNYPGETSEPGRDESPELDKRDTTPEPDPRNVQAGSDKPCRFRERTKVPRPEPKPEGMKQDFSSCWNDINAQLPYISQACMITLPDGRKLRAVYAGEAVNGETLWLAPNFPLQALPVVSWKPEGKDG